VADFYSNDPMFVNKQPKTRYKMGAELGKIGCLNDFDPMFR
jgi:hypothetical protein